MKKTNLLQPGESQTVTVTFSIEDMASYDENNAKAYVLEKGDYVISINSDSHTVLDQKTYTADKDVVYKGENKRALGVQTVLFGASTIIALVGTLFFVTQGRRHLHNRVLLKSLSGLYRSIYDFGFHLLPGTSIEISEENK